MGDYAPPDFTPATGEDHTFTSKLPPATVPELTIPQYVFQGVESYLERVAIVDTSDGREYTYRQLKRLVENSAAGMVQHGLKKGDVVLVILPNMAEYFIVVLGAMAAGGVFSGVNPASPSVEIEKQVRDSEAKMVITNLAGYEKVCHLKLPIVVIGENPPPEAIPLSSLFEADGQAALPFSTSPDDLCALPYSSGTTGVSKGVMLTHRNILSILSQTLADYERIPPEIRETLPQYCALGLMPFFHIYGITGIGCSTMRLKGKVVVMERYELRKMLEALIKYEVQFAPLVPPIILSLVKNPLVDEYDLSKLKLNAVMTAAAPLAPELQRAFEAKFPGVEMRQAYGLTEYSCVTLSHCAPGHARGNAKKGSVGFIIPNTEMKFIDPDTGKSLPANTPGEICVRGGAVMKGYYKNPDATKSTVDDEGWLHTGDVGYIDDDGDIFIVDRVKELIKYKGFQVPPAELEAILISHPLIEDVAVIPFPDEAAGEIPVACIVRKQGSDLSQEEIFDFVSSKVAAYKKIRRIEFVSEIPKSPAGKTMRRLLRDSLLKHKTLSKSS
ncbi:hypothetical protein SELMODRAFT_115483 [Selaginella moellendorffii]|uniref:4-coumarate--CoA ligase n=1 Tax=Selaginella moellendorffii TaxID=88036 RepID=D8SEY8_SELML|nr:4-coumarate--CoA ligase-like 1 [Selaginella moellendorffii]EFJ16949.1 hypothetical protein SELMODRAFT_115483 [Selaginella moellendorffii]|eukprot:XP_002981856.1 4-coumarate--CoA ligase-like 1 [Selaginella moellendorffii]